MGILLRRRTREVPDSLEVDDRHRTFRHDRCGVRSDRLPPASGEHRDAPGVRDRLRSRSDHASHQPERRAALPLPVGSVRADHGHPDVPPPDVLPSDRELVAPRRLAPHRPRDLLQLWAAPFGPAGGPGPGNPAPLRRNVSENPLFATKSMERLMEEMKGENRLRRVLGPVALTALGVGAIIGTGIFVLTGVAAHDKAGPALILSFVLAGFACACAGLCYAEFASMIPVAGSAYTYAYATLGEFLAWIIGWDLILEYAVASSTVAHGWSHYFISFIGLFGITLPNVITANPFDFDPLRQQWVATGGYGNLPAFLVVLLITIILVIGIRESA